MNREMSDEFSLYDVLQKHEC